MSDLPALSADESAHIGRNEPCPCGSGKKYKRCHGVAAAPKLGAPKAMPALPEGVENPLAGMDPQMMNQLAQAVQRLPRGQMQKLQSIMQRAMSGKDVSREAQEFERTLPPNFQELMKGFTLPPEMMAQMGAAQSPGALDALDVEVTPVAPAPEPSTDMSAEDARQIVARAAAEGKISAEQAQTLLEGTADKTPAPDSKPSKKFWKR